MVSTSTFMQAMSAICWSLRPNFSARTCETSSQAIWPSASPPASRQAAGSNEPSVMEYALQLDQQMRHFEARIIRGQQDTFLSIVRDITERKLAEESLQRAQTELALATRRLTMGALAASIAHEISQPLTAIISNANAGLRLLEKGQLEELKATFEDVVKDGQRAASVMHQTRALFTERAPRTESLDLNQLILNVVAVVRREISRNRVVLSTDLADGCRRCTEIEPSFSK